MNKAELIDVLTEKLGTDRRTATDAVEHIVDTIVRAVHKGQSVTITGFGVFEQRKRAARVARNPRTGETVKVKPTSVPAFRPGAQFKAVIAGKQKLPATGPAVKRGSAAAAQEDRGQEDRGEEGRGQEDHGRQGSREEDRRHQGSREDDCGEEDHRGQEDHGHQGSREEDHRGKEDHRGQGPDQDHGGEEDRRQEGTRQARQHALSVLSTGILAVHRLTRYTD